MWRTSSQEHREGQKTRLALEVSVPPFAETNPDIPSREEVPFCTNFPVHVQSEENERTKKQALLPFEAKKLLQQS